MTTPWWAVIVFHQYLGLAVLIAISYGLLLRRLAKIVEPKRLELAQRGERYLDLCDTKKERQQITFYLENAFDPWVAILASFLIWFALVKVIRTGAHKSEERDEREHDEIAWLFSISAFAANPLFGAITVLEILLIAIVVLLIEGNSVLLRRAIERMLETQAERRGGHQLHAH